jgi:hypothetical protein
MRHVEDLSTEWAGVAQVSHSGVLGSNLGLDAKYPERCFRGFRGSS